MPKETKAEKSERLAKEANQKEAERVLELRYQRQNKDRIRDNRNARNARNKGS